MRGEPYDPAPSRRVHGVRLVGLIPCSDAFGVDLQVDHYRSALQALEAQKAAKHADAKKTPEALAADANLGVDFPDYSPRFEDPIEEFRAGHIGALGSIGSRASAEADIAAQRVHD